MCAGEDLPPSSDDADEGCQWEIQTEEGLGSLLELAGVGRPRRSTLFLGEERVPIVRDERFRKSSDYLLKHILGFVFCKP
jgi:hypothetical protein